MAIHWQRLFSVWPSNIILPVLDTGLRKAIPKQDLLSCDFPSELVLINKFTLWTYTSIYNSYLYFKENEKYLWEFPEKKRPLKIS